MSVEKKPIYSADRSVSTVVKNPMEKVYQKIEELKVIHYLKSLVKTKGN